MKKLITFCLWGEDPKYCKGAVENARLAQVLYPGWTCRFYLGRSVPTETYTALIEQPNVRIVNMHVEGDWRGMFWRFFPASEDDVDVFISRDCDSRLSEREVAAVNEWLSSPKLIHSMRDHPYHTTPILGGMWGAKKYAIPDMKALISLWNQEDRWQTDQEFLRSVIWPRYHHKVMTHDDWNRFPMADSRKFFPTPRHGTEFVGAIIGPNNERLHPEHHEMIPHA